MAWRRVGDAKRLGGRAVCGKVVGADGRTHSSGGGGACRCIPLVCGKVVEDVGRMRRDEVSVACLCCHQK